MNENQAEADMGQFDNEALPLMNKMDENDLSTGISFDGQRLCLHNNLHENNIPIT